MSPAESPMLTAIRSALLEKDISLERIEKAVYEAKRLARVARETGKPIDLGEVKSGMSWPKRIMLAIVTVAAITAALWFVWR